MIFKLHYNQISQLKTNQAYGGREITKTGVSIQPKGTFKLDSKISLGKFFIMSTEFDKNISDWSHDCTDHKNGIDFFMRLVKWPKIDIKKCQNLIFKVNFLMSKIIRIFLKKFIGEYQFSVAWKLNDFCS